MLHVDPSFSEPGDFLQNMSQPRIQSIRCLAAIGLAALCGCGPAPPIKVAFIGGLSGRVSELAIDGRNGAQLAVETLNAGPGPRYELRVHDNARSIDEGPLAIDAIADEGDAFAIGPMTSVLAGSMLAEASKRHVVLISPTANSDQLSGMDDYFFRVIAPAGPGAEKIAEAAIARGLKSVSVMAEWRNRSYSEPFTARFAARYQALGGRPPHVIRYETDQNPDYAAVAAELLVSHPKMVLLVCGAVDASIVAQQLRRLDPEVQIAMASWAANVQLLQLGGRAVEGALVLQALDLDSAEPAYVDFRRRFVERFGSVPSQAAVYSYDATMMGAAGLRRKQDAQSLRDALRQPGKWPGLQQPLVLDRFGDSVNRFRLSEVHSGRFVMLAS
jgi:branched-chain amino acid transport system substrate-binding protein